MHLSKALRCFAAFLALAALSGCRTSGTWNSPTWATSSWNPTTWSLAGSPPPSLASKDSGLPSQEPYLADSKPELPSRQASPTQTPSERRAAQERAASIASNPYPNNQYPETPASYNDPAVGQYPSTSGTGTPAQPASYRDGVNRTGEPGVGVGTPYVAPQQGRYDVPSTPTGSYSGSGYQGGNQGGLVNPPSQTGGCRYDTGSDRYGLSATPAPRYGNSAGQNGSYAAPTNTVGNTGYQPGNTGYQPGNTGYTPPGSQPYQPPQPGYQTPQGQAPQGIYGTPQPNVQTPPPGVQSPQSGVQGYQTPPPYQPATGNTTSTVKPWRPGGTTDYPGTAPTTDNQVVPTQYVAPEPY